MYKIVLIEEISFPYRKTNKTAIYYPGDEKAVLINPILNLELNTAGTLSFICPPENPYYEKLFNRKTIIGVYKDERKSL